MTSQRSREPGLSDPLEERPSIHPRQAMEVKGRDMLIRFVAGAVTSVVAGILTTVFGPHIGGIMLAFPAILAASLTLIAKEDDKEDARQDARGAVVGGAALAVFAVVSWGLFTQLPGGVVLVLAGAAWLFTAIGLYVVLWWR